jgi:osmotically-inducible protein OsmY
MNATNLVARLRTPLLLTAAIATLSGCFGAALIGAGAGALFVSDRRVSETYVTDEGIELRAGKAISDAFGEKIGDKAHVNVTSYNRMVLLTGEVPTAAAKADAEKAASAVANVKAISNELAIAGASAYSARSNDAYITSKVKARFVDYNKFAANHVKVVTEAGVVFLLGLVTPQEADAAVDIARTTAGVLKVIRVFELINPAQAQAIDGTAAKKSDK